MKNKEALNSMTDDALAHFFCTNLMESAAEKADKFVCDICPVSKLCKKGGNGFRVWLDCETTDSAGIQLEKTE